MIEIGRNCNHLKELYISKCDNITDTSIEIVKNSIHHLHSLYIEECKNISSDMRVRNVKLIIMFIIKLVQLFFICLYIRCSSYYVLY